MSEAIDLIKQRINEEARFLVRSSDNEEKLITIVEKLLTKVYELERQSKLYDLFTPELIKKLNRIYNHFGGRANKLDKLFQECGEYRDAFFLDDRSSKLTPEKVTEICDVFSCAIQLYLNEEIIREAFEKVVDKTITKINNNYYK